MIILEDFAKRALRRISPIYEDSDFIKEFYNGIDASLTPIREFFLKLREQSFIETVDDFIEFQEHKYSLTPRPDLTLEQRRARLGIKARQHYPINPARLEKTIYDNFGLATYLSEDKRGWIEMIYNRATEESYYSTLEYLRREKPAHLDLSLTHSIVVPIGGEGEDQDEDVVIRPDDLPIPTSEEDVKNYPRVFVGVAHAFDVSINIGLAKIEDVQTDLFVGVASCFENEITVKLASLPDDTTSLVYSGVALLSAYELTIDSEDKPFRPRYIENPTSSLAIAGGEVTTPTLRPLLLATRVLSAEASPVPFIVPSAGAIARGAPLHYSPPPTIDDDEWDTVKIFFDFPISRHRRVRGIALPNPREDLTREEIKAAGQYAVDNKLVMNSAGEYATGVTRAALKVKDVKKIF